MGEGHLGPGCMVSAKRDNFCSMSSLLLLAVLVDYTSTIIYAGEPIRVCLRNADKDKFAGSVEQYDTEGKLLRKDRFLITSTVKFRFPQLKSLRKIIFRDRSDSITLKILGIKEPYLKLKQRGSLLLTESGEFVVLRIEKVVRKPERKWAWIKWLRKKFGTPEERFKSVGLILPDSYFEVTGSVCPAVAYPVPVDSAPVLSALTRVLIEPPRTEVVVILTGFDESAGTEPLLYGRAIEAIIQRLQASGTKRFVLLQPLRRPGYNSVIRMYTSQLRDIAYRYRERFWSIGISESAWELSKKIYLNRLSDSGKKRLRSYLTRLVQSLLAN